MCGSSNNYTTYIQTYPEEGWAPSLTTEAINEECEPYTKYVWGWIPPHTIETQDAYVLHSTNFKEFMYSYYNKIDDSYKFNSYRNACKFEENSCDLEFISKEESEKGGPYFTVLEKVNSTNEIYFSDLINIPYESVENVYWTQDSQEGNYPLKLKQIELQEDNKLLIEFENAESVILKEPGMINNLIFLF
ncbi:hypothetical protein BMS3Abin17_00431 [archaeon BMS3Abin17]|nr:hypothetical protein BMS3Abin17_00431 [archaeon BMS3Abin17]HDZ60327.1 hypothetical protein [Candidatus Pacearchaeota archaeon]